MVSRQIIGAISGIVISIFGGLLGWLILPPIIKSQIINQIVIREGTEQFERFEKLPIPVLFKVYIFNVTNAESVIHGRAMPNVQEIGPYIYKEYREKQNVRFSSDKTRVFFRQKLRFEFDPQLSAPYSENDQIVVLNTLLNAVLQTTEVEMKNILSSVLGNPETSNNPITRIVSRILGGRIKSLLQITDIVEPSILTALNLNIQDVFGKHTQIFMKTIVKTLLFDGVKFCENPGVIGNVICEVVKSKPLKTIHRSSDDTLKFAFFRHKNITNDGVYEVDTGMADPTQVGQITMWEAKEHLDVWPSQKGRSSVCNMINGTDASSFRPFQKPELNLKLYTFSTDICRSVEVSYKSEQDFKGIPTLRYEAADTFLEHLGPEYGSECFCPNQIPHAIAKPNGCLYSGALDLMPCLDAPMVLTAPHMLNTAPEYTSLITGQKPDFERHIIYLEIEPNTGLPMRGSRKVQFNMFIRKINEIDATKNLKTVLMPILWVDEAVELNVELADLIRNRLVKVLYYLNVAIWVMIIGGILISICMSIWYYKKRKADDILTVIFVK